MCRVSNSLNSRCLRSCMDRCFSILLVFPPLHEVLLLQILQPALFSSLDHFLPSDSTLYSSPLDPRVWRCCFVIISHTFEKNMPPLMRGNYNLGRHMIMMNWINWNPSQLELSQSLTPTLTHSCERTAISRESDVSLITANMWQCNNKPYEESASSPSSLFLLLFPSLLLSPRGLVLCKWAWRLAPFVLQGSLQQNQYLRTICAASLPGGRGLTMQLQLQYLPFSETHGRACQGQMHRSSRVAVI